MAANMPLLVERDWNLGLTGALVYSTHLESRADAPPQIRLSPHPVARWPGGEQSVGALAVVSGNIILGTVDDGSRTMVVVHDAGGGGGGADQAPRLLGSKRCPAMLPVGDGDTVVVMDTVGACGFEALRRLPDGGWRADPLPDPPVHDDDDEEEDDMDEDDDDCVDVESYFAIGTRVWISVSGRGTFSLDTAAVESGASWRKEGDWELPLRQRAFFAPELGGGGSVVVIGIACAGADGIDRGDPWQQSCQVCALDVGEGGRPPAVRRVWQIPAARPEDVAPGEEVSLAYLGNGRICVARSVVVEPSEVTGLTSKGTSFTVAELTTDGAGELLQLANNCHVWPQGHFGQASFIQPA